MPTLSIANSTSWDGPTPPGDCNVAKSLFPPGENSTPYTWPLGWFKSAVLKFVTTPVESAKSKISITLDTEGVDNATANCPFPLSFIYPCPFSAGE